jgi:GNAT superfamily N-acetyltransferase
MMLTLTTCHGAELAPYVPELARLRITVFREFPYLYDGDANYEARYLTTYSASPDCFVVLAYDGDAIVGASTALPLNDETDNLKAPFRACGINVDEVFYLGESVLLAPYRGQGVGKQFFRYREAEARRQGFRQAAFCAVQRPDHHPAKPTGYRPLDDFWQRQGFVKHPELVAQMSWRDIGEAHESLKPMVFWLKALESGA